MAADAPRRARVRRGADLRGVIALVAALGLPTACLAHVKATRTSSNPAPVAWDLANLGTVQEEVAGGAVTFRVHAAGSDDMPFGEAAAAVEEAAAAWTAPAESAMAFARGADTQVASTTDDGVFPVFWLDTSTVVTQGTPDPSDDVDVGGALAVTFVWWRTSGPEAGEIVDANVVVNGFSHSWTRDPGGEPGRHDLAAVLAHEMGHALGLAHSPVGGATMFPRVMAGDARSRSLEDDDLAGVASLHPTPAFLAGTGTLAGRVTDAGGAAVPGAHVVIEDASGRVRGAALTIADGTYSIDGVPDEPLAAWVEPLDAADGSVVLFSSESLPAYWAGPGTEASFRTAPSVSVAVPAGAVGAQDFNVARLPPSLDVTRVRDSSGAWANRGAWLVQGDALRVVGVAAPAGRLPTSGQPLSVSGTGVTVVATTFGTLGGGALSTISITVNVEANAAPGLRSFVVADGPERTVATGHLEILPAPTADADGDTILDVDDGTTDADGDGIANRLDLDSDGDGLGDALEAGDSAPATPGVDTDGDGAPDFLDQDSDADGLGDASEGATDGDGDGLAAFRDADRDGGGEADGNEATWGRDPDGAGDDVTSSPGEVPDGLGGPPLLVTRSPGALALGFTAAARADWHRAWTGPLPLGAGAWPAQCAVSGTAATLDFVSLPKDAFLLVTGVNWVGEGPAGGAVSLPPPSCR